MRKTHALIQLAMAIMTNSGDKQWGYDLAKRSGLRSGVLYPILRRMHEDGWLTDGWEAEADTGGTRPPRRYYELTDKGSAELGAVLRAAASDTRFRSLNVRFT